MDMLGTHGTNRLDSAAPRPGILRRCFVGPSGLRAGWRLLIFISLVFLLLLMASVAGESAYSALCSLKNPALPLILEEGLVFACVLLATFVMAKVERRRVGDYGLPWRRMFRCQFWQGAGIGFASLSLLILVLRAFGLFAFEGLALHGDEIWIYGLCYVLLFVLVGLAEDSLSYGYALFTLSTGVGFWPAAVLLSALFAVVHLGNPGETWLGILNNGLIGLLFCLLLRRTGDLWMVVGVHAAWDWGETYLYGVANSGRTVEGHLFNSSISGPAWLAGGSVGPEGSVFCTALLIALGFVACRLLREAKFPEVRIDPESVNPAVDSTVGAP